MTFAEFWPVYLAAHADPRNRALHYTGTLGAFGCAAAALGTGAWLWLLAAPLAGYLPAWIGHLVFERNRPATFGHPVWSLLADLLMLAQFLGGRLGKEWRRAGPR
jgi:hypothetical protein